MTPSLKKLCIFSLAMTIGAKAREIISTAQDIYEIDRGLILVNASALEAAGTRAMATCGWISLDGSRIKQIYRKIYTGLEHGQDSSVSEMLSFLFAGLNDLAHHCRDKSIIKSVEDAALNFMTVFDPNLEDEATHEAAMVRYEKWAA